MKGNGRIAGVSAARSAARSVARSVVAALAMAMIVALGTSQASASSLEPVTPNDAAAVEQISNQLHVSKEGAKTLLDGVRVQISKPTGLNTPNASVGFGWSIYWRLSPADQQFVLQAGAIAVTAIICVASAGTACIVAGAIAGIFAVWVSIYYNPRCWIEIKTSYSGRLQGVNRNYRC